MLTLLELKAPDIGKLSSVMGTMYDKRALANGEPTENVGGDATTEEELILAVGTEAYHGELTATDIFVASVVEFALILRKSDYKANSDLNALINRLSDLDLSNDEFKEEFREIVILYRQKLETVQ